MSDFLFDVGYHTMWTALGLSALVTVLLVGAWLFNGWQRRLAARNRLTQAQVDRIRSGFAAPTAALRRAEDRSYELADLEGEAL